MAQTGPQALGRHAGREEDGVLLGDPDVEELAWGPRPPAWRARCRSASPPVMPTTLGSALAKRTIAWPKASW
jgi:hypothetical protein